MFMITSNVFLVSDTDLIEQFLYFHDKIKTDKIFINGYICDILLL